MTEVEQFVVFLVVLEDVPVLINDLRVAISERNFRVAEEGKQLSEKVRLAGIITLGDPNEFSSSKFETFLPLSKRGSGVLLVQHDAHLWVAFVTPSHLETVVSGGIVQNDDFEVAE